MIDESKRVEFEGAVMCCNYYGFTDVGNAYHYDLVVPHLLTKEQMELLLKMIGQMKRGSSFMGPVKCMWAKEET